MPDSTPRTRQAAVSTAWDTASTATGPATGGGTVAIRSGSRIVAWKAARASPQAILTWVSSAAIRAKLWASLPVPAVVGTPTLGRNVPRPRPTPL